jgi:endoglucanase
MKSPLTRRSLLGNGFAVTIQMAFWPLGRESAAAGEKPDPVGFTGVNLAGADFGKLPGKHNFDYFYPSSANIDYYVELGFNVIRLPFRWERLEPKLGGPFAPDEQALLVDCVSYATKKNLHVVLDPHNYAKRAMQDDGWTAEHLIGSAQVPVKAFSLFWSRLAELFKHDTRVIFGLMNEPAGIDLEAWFSAANAAIASIRATGAINLILIPGINWTGAHSWISSGNTRMGEVSDPANNFAFDVHQYLDGDSSGTSPEAVSDTIGSERIQEFQKWARQKGFKGFLGEFNGGPNKTSYNALNDLCREMAANSDVWLGWTAWAGGRLWPENYFFNLEPKANGQQREQTQILALYARHR